MSFTRARLISFVAIYATLASSLFGLPAVGAPTNNLTVVAAKDGPSGPVVLFSDPLDANLAADIDFQQSGVSLNASSAIAALDRTILGPQSADSFDLNNGYQGASPVTATIGGQTVTAGTLVQRRLLRLLLHLWTPPLSFRRMV